MTQTQKQALIDATAAASKKFADTYEAAEPEEAGFYKAWELAWGAYQEAKTLCPPCAVSDPGPPPPP